MLALNMPMSANEGLHGVADYVKFVVLKLFVFTTYIVSHIYDVGSSFQEFLQPLSKNIFISSMSLTRSTSSTTVPGLYVSTSVKTMHVGKTEKIVLYFTACKRLQLPM